MEVKVFHTYKEFRDYYLPGEAEKYPIEMRVSQEEHDLIMNRRGGYIPVSQVNPEVVHD